MVAVGISGATGCIYGIRLLEALRALGQETELILSDWGAETIRLETGYTVERSRRWLTGYTTTAIWPHRRPAVPAARTPWSSPHAA